MRFFLLPAFLLLPHLSQAQWDVRSVATSGMDGISDTALVVCSGNPSASAYRHTTLVRSGFIPAPFSLSELRRIGIAVSHSLNGWGFAVHAGTYGARLFRNDQVRFGVARRLTARSAIGLFAGPEIWRADGYDALWGWVAGVGFLLSEGPALLGARYSTSFGTGEAAHEIIAGVTVQAARGVTLTGELGQEPGRRLSAGYSVRVRPAEGLELFMGWKDNPQIAGGGFAFRYGGIELMYGGNWHAVLGWTYGVGVEVEVGG